MRTNLIIILTCLLFSSVVLAQPIGGGSGGGVGGTVTCDAGVGPWPATDNGGSLTVDGTVTANLSAVDNAVLDSIDLNTANILADTNTIQSDTTSIQIAIENLEGVEGSPLNSGVLLQGDDGTDRINLSATPDGYLETVIREVSQPTRFRASENHATAQTNNQLIAAAGASVSNCITDVIISNGATAGSVKIVEDTAGTPVDLIEIVYVAINGGAVINLTTPVCGTANTDVGFTSTTVTTHSVTVLGYEE